MPQTIKLFPHNEVGYQNLIAGLTTYPLAFIEHATGTGKSFILLKYLYQNAHHKRILFVSMHDEMFDQLFNDQMPTLGLKRSDFTCFDTLIYPNIIKYNMQDIIDNYDCIVFDEAHHCGAPKWSKYVRELKELVLKTKGKVMIGATATSIRYLDDYTDVSEQYFDGHTVSRLPISTSILQNLLPAPLVINSLTSCNDKLFTIIKKLNRLPQSDETILLANRLRSIEDKIKIESSVASTLERYDVKPGEKYIIFASSIKDAKKKEQEAQEWFKNIGPIKTFRAHSGQTKEKNKAQIAAFSQKRDEISLMFAVDIFNEGFHIEGVDGILMFRKTKSPIIYFQQLGRALSFSARKKQIKIFDFVDNITNNDVIYELYREVITEARRLIEKDSTKKNFYEEILSRFQIIDETTKIIDELNSIEKIIDDNYIAKNRINTAISKLEEYRMFYPTTNFNAELEKNYLGRDYVQAYNYICRMNEELTINQIERINKLNIFFSYEINLSPAKRLELLNGYATIRQLKEAKLEKFISSYITFVNTYHRRPSPSPNEIENTLYLNYRHYLWELTPHKISTLISKYNFTSTVEEIVLTGSYPSKEMLEEYIIFIKNKIANGRPLDKIEIKVMQKLVPTISLKEISFIELIKSYNIITIRIEEAIETIANYKKMYNPYERFPQIQSFIGERPIYNALKTIYKYASHITTSQFIKLLTLSIDLPPTIQMTLEQRQTLLGPYASFYEKEQGEHSYITNEYINYIKTHGTRPSTSSSPKLQEKYEFELMSLSSTKIKEICSILKYFNIDLSFYEKLIIKEPIPLPTINTYLENIVIKLHNNTIITTEELKILRAIKRNKYQTSTNLDELILQITKINDISEYIIDLKNVLAHHTPNSYEAKSIIRKITNNYKHITQYQLKILFQLGIPISEELASSINKLGHNLNLYEQEQSSQNTFLNTFLNYITTHHTHPSPDIPLFQEYRLCLATSSRTITKKIIQSLIDQNIPLTFEEKVLANLPFPDKELISYQSLINQKIENKTPLDRLESHIISSLINRGHIKGKLYKSITHQNILTEEEKLERRIVDSLRENIARNPSLPINFDSTLYKISVASRRELEEYRMCLLSPAFFADILTKIKSSKQPLSDCLTVSEFCEYQKFLSVKHLSSDTISIINTINSLDIDYRFLQKGFEHEKFIKQYLDYIKTHFGMRPSLTSDKPTELSLAITFSETENLLTPFDYQRISNAIKESRESETTTDFYERFIAFIHQNGRFPCGNSDDPTEVMLNNVYVNYSKKLTKEQLLNLRKLRKKYSQATIKANLAFSKKYELKK